MTLAHKDYVRFNEALAGMYVSSVTDGPLNAIVNGLIHIVGGEIACAHFGNHQTSASAYSAEGVMPPTEEIGEAFRSHPRLLNAPLGNVVSISDFLSRQAWQQRSLYHLSKPYLHLEDDLGVTLECQQGNLLQACIMRERRSFQSQDRVLFSLMLPHFEAILKLQSIANPQPPALSELGLTKREQEVLFWIAEGKTNAEVAGILSISPGTVRVHLEHIYPKLGVENRHGAARRAMEKLHPQRFKMSSTVTAQVA